MMGKSSSDICENLSMEYSWTISPKHFKAAILYVGLSFLHSLNIESRTYRGKERERYTIITRYNLSVGSYYSYDSDSVKNYQTTKRIKPFFYEFTQVNSTIESSSTHVPGTEMSSSFNQY